MPGEEGDVVVNDIENESSEADVEVLVERFGSACITAGGESVLDTEFVKRPVTG